MKVQAILNPRAGLRARRALGALEQGRPAWGRIAVELTRSPGHARELAVRAAQAGVELLLAVGGDGTVNEVAEGLLGSDTALGLVPVGSGNGLARTLGIPLAPRAALRAIEEGVTRRMDVGFVNGRPFLNVAGAGLDAHVGAEFHRHGSRGGRRGVFSYVRLSLLSVLRYEVSAFALEADGTRFDGRAYVVAFANGRQYGAGAVIAPRAALNDGRLDVVIFEEAPLPAVVVQAPRLFLGGIERFRGYRSFASARATLSAPRPFAFHRDGEPEDDSARLEVTLRPRALRVRVAAHVDAAPDGPFLSATGEE